MTKTARSPASTDAADEARRLVQQRARRRRRPAPPIPTVGNLADQLADAWLQQHAGEVEAFVAGLDVLGIDRGVALRVAARKVRAKALATAIGREFGDPVVLELTADDYAHMRNRVLRRTTRRAIAEVRKAGRDPTATMFGILAIAGHAMLCRWVLGRTDIGSTTTRCRGLGRPT